MDYYKKELFLAQVDKNDNVIGKIERWKAHKEAVLHRGFTMILTFNDKMVLQHRKHLAFDGYFDLTFSSHQIYVHGALQTDEDAIRDTLKREWSIDGSGLKSIPKYLGKFYYKAKDPNSIFTEHEIDYIYAAELKNLPTPNPDFAYGFELIDKQNIENCLALEASAKWAKLKIGKFKTAPWVEEITKIIK